MLGQEPSEAIVSRVIRVIAETQKLPLESVTIDKTFEELKIDSLDGINILFGLESEFKLDVPDDAAREILSVRAAALGIEKLLAQKEAAGQ
jgi:acyl carrier protein